MEQRGQTQSKNKTPKSKLLQKYMDGPWCPHTFVPIAYDIATARQCRCSSTADTVTALRCVMAISVCVCVLLQSKWPFGKASRVIIVNYSVKLRVLLRGKQSEWAISSSTSWESGLIAKQTSLTDPGCLEHMQAYWVQEVIKREINTETVPTPVFLMLIIHYPAHSHPPLLCSSL